MKIALTCSHGGHLTEILQLMKAFEGHDIFFITYKSSRTADIPYKKYLLENIGKSPFRFLKSMPIILGILTKEKPDLIVSTGSEIAIPTFYLGKVFGSKTIFIESICRVKNLSVTGKILYMFPGLFLVQWKELSKKYNKAKYWGGIL